MKFIFSILLIIISIILFFWVVNPLYSEVSSLRTEVATYNVALNNSKELQATRDQLTENYKNINKLDRERLERFLPNTVNNIRFILEIERIANMHSMPIKNVRFQPERVSGDGSTPDNSKVPAKQGTTVVTSGNQAASLPYGSFPIEFTTEGDYNTFVLFLKDLERNLRLIDIKSISFTVPQADKNGIINPNIYTYNLKIETYWLK